MDIRTLYLASFLLTVFLTVGMTCLAWARPQDRHIRAWAAANGLSMIAQIIVGLRGLVIPELLSILATGPAVFATAYSAFLGFEFLLESRRFSRPATAIFVFGSLGWAALVFLGSSALVRTVVLSAIQTPLLCLVTACCALVPSRPALRWPLRLAALAFGSDAAVIALRGVTALISGVPPMLPTAGGSQLIEGAYLMYFGLLVIGVNYAYVWLIIAETGARHLDEQRRLLAEVEATRAALERQAADLRRAKAEAEAASAAKSIFLATMSHEIRTPLNGVLGFADILLQSSLTEQQRRFVELQRDAGAGLLAVINDILDFSRLEAGKLAIEPVDADFPALLRSCAALFAPAAADKSLELKAEIDPTVPGRGRLDAYRLRQALTNLLSNAVKFTRAGSVALHARAIGQRLRIEVRDTGIGIPADKLGSLFEQFSQVDSSITREFGGTGLGLAISRRIVALMGGTLGVDSELGVGSVFWIDVPFQPALLPQAEPQPAEGAAAEPGRRLNVLVAEDVVPNQIMIEILLTRAGHEVTIVENGAAAVEAAQHGTYDLILMDLQMPVMDGLEAARLIRALPGRRGRIPIVALSANVMADEIAACRAAGMTAHLAKPIDSTALVDLLEQIGAEATAS
jgi:signal transduction histidine kinase/CheY-like chemotaxis protein